VATYEYRCDQHGSFDVRRPMQQASDPVPCAVCGSDAGRIFSPPRLTRTPPGLSAARDRAERSREAPDVVAAVPPGPARASRVSTHPRHARLPRP